MTHFFFDYTAKDEAMCDYRGDEFLSPEGAIEFAQATATLLQHDLADAWSGWSIEVRNAEGKRFFSLPVAIAA